MFPHLQGIFHAGSRHFLGAQRSDSKVGVDITDKGKTPMLGNAESVGISRGL